MSPITAQEKIQQNMDDYTVACNTGDVEAYMATLTPDAVVLPPDQARVEGRENIGAWVKEGFFDPFTVTFEGIFDRIVVVGSEAFAPGRFTLHLEPKDGSVPIDTSGAFFDVFREEPPGSWKLAHAIFNFDKPSG